MRETSGTASNEPQSTVDVIYRETAKLFARRGYEAVSMRDIAEACQIPMASLYYHFRSKSELHDEITQYRFEEFIGGLAAKQEALPPGEESPAALLGLIFDAVVADPTVFNLMQRDLHHFDQDARRQHCGARYAAFVRLIGDAVRRHGCADPDDTVVFALAAMITGYCELVQADARSSGSERERFIEGQRRAMLGVVRRILPPPAAGAASKAQVRD